MPEPDTRSPARLLVSANNGWALTNYRLGLMKALIEAGYEVHAAVPPGKGIPELRSIGVIDHALPMSPRGTSVLADAGLFLRYFRLLRALRPAAFLGFTIKPNIFGSLAARLLGIKTIVNVTGLGTLFVRETALTKLVTGLYRSALRRVDTVFFQNDDDAALFLEKSLVGAAQVRRLPGSGIDLNRFAPVERPPGGPVVFLLAARLLWEKGISEFIEAAALVRQDNAGVRFQILGLTEPKSAAAVSKRDLDQWAAEGAVEFLGSAEDVRPAIAAADCIVLPTYYREGVPRILLEAAAMARAVIATDMPGCRDAVTDGETGFLCEPRSALSLADAMRRIVAMSPDARRAIGQAGRLKMQREFDQDIVHRAYLRALSE